MNGESQGQKEIRFKHAYFPTEQEIGYGHVRIHAQLNYSNWKHTHFYHLSGECRE